MLENVINGMPKTIIIIGQAHPYKGGIANFTERLALQFKNEGCIVTIYSFSFLYPKFLFPGKEQKKPGSPASGVEILSVINSINPFNWWKVANAIVMLERPDIVVINYWLPLLAPCLGSIARLIKRRCNAKIVGIAHNIIPHEKRPFDKQLTKYFCKQISAWIVMAENVMEDLKNFEPNIIKVKP